MATDNTLEALALALADGSVRVVDLTQPLSETTPVLQLPPPFANTPGLSPRGHQPLRRPRPRLGVDDADRRRARRHPLRRPDPLDHRPRRRGRRLGRAVQARRAGRGDRQVRRGRRGPELPAHAGRHPGLGERARPAARRAAGCSCAPAGTPAPTTRRRSSTARETPGPDAEAARWLAETSRDRRLRRRDRRHRRGRRALLRPAVPGPPLPARRGQVRPHPAREPGRAAADRGGRGRRAFEARRRHRLAVAGASRWSEQLA